MDLPFIKKETKEREMWRDRGVGKGEDKESIEGEAVTAFVD